jgi:hypothetical protein
MKREVAPTADFNRILRTGKTSLLSAGYELHSSYYALPMMASKHCDIIKTAGNSVETMELYDMKSLLRRP